MLGEDSSSQNDNLTILSVEKRGATGQVTKIDLNDGSSFFIASVFAEGKNFQEGDFLSTEEVTELSYQAELFLAKNKSLDLLSRAEQSEGLLRQKLLKRQFENDVISEVIVWLTEKGYLDNNRYAEEWTVARLKRKPEGKQAILAGLRRRGVDRETAEEVVNRLVTPRKEEEALVRAFEKVRRRTDDDEKVYKTLLRKGFRTSNIMKLLNPDE